MTAAVAVAVVAAVAAGFRARSYRRDLLALQAACAEGVTCHCGHLECFHRKRGGACNDLCRCLRFSPIAAGPLLLLKAESEP